MSLIKLGELIDESLIFPSLPVKTKEEAIEFMVDSVCLQSKTLNKDEILDLVIERERLSSTGIGSGIAIPHVRSEQFTKHYLLFGRNAKGIDFDSVDGKPVHLIFMVLSPSHANTFHLQLLARVSKMLHDTSFREHLMTEKNTKNISKFIKDKDAKY